MKGSSIAYLSNIQEYGRESYLGPQGVELLQPCSETHSMYSAISYSDYARSRTTQISTLGSASNEYIMLDTSSYVQECILPRVVCNKAKLEDTRIRHVHARMWIQHIRFSKQRLLQEGVIHYGCRHLFPGPFLMVRAGWRALHAA